jgi:glycosyltransferase involved in cell wall biosynthesis
MSTFTGGVETATAALIEGLENYSHQFEFHLVATNVISQEDKHCQVNGITYHFLNVSFRPRFAHRVIKVRKLLMDLQPDLIHCQDNLAEALASLLIKSDRRMFTVHGYKRHEWKKRTGWEKWSAAFDSLIERYIYYRFNYFISISDYSRLVIGPGKECYSIPNAVRAGFFDLQVNSTNKNQLFLFVGGYEPLKNPLGLVKAHNALQLKFPDLQTVFCGEVKDRGYFSIMQQEAGPGIRFVGSQNQEQLMEWFGRACVLVLPSSQENSPIVIVEAMAAGIPVIATNVGGVADLLEDGKTGFLFKIGNIEQLIQKLELLLASPELSSQMGTFARNVATTRFHPDVVASQTIKVYEKLLGLPLNDN